MSVDFAKFPLIPRQTLFGNPARTAPCLSPDGMTLAWLAPLNGVRNIFVAPVDNLAAARALTNVSGRPIMWHEWSADGAHLLFLKDENGDENYHCFAVNPLNGATRDLTPFENVSARFSLSSPDLPGRVILEINDRDPGVHDAWMIDLATGKRELLYENTEGYGHLMFDWQGKLRLTARSDNASGGNQLYRVVDGRVEKWMLIPFEDSLTTMPMMFNRAGTHLYMRSTIGRNTAAMLRIDLATGVETLIAENARADLGWVMWHTESFEAMAISFDFLRQQWQALDHEAAADLAIIAAISSDASYFQQSISADGSRWVVATYRGDQPLAYHLYDRKSGEISALFVTRPELAHFALAEMHPVVIPARDGLKLVSYYTLPPWETGKTPSKPLPTVLVVHGGPWARDDYGFNGFAQWLANRGYCVLSVNYRASTGFGKAFVNAGDQQHAAKMHDDLIDSVEWAIAMGIAQRDKVAILGASYGGYASFVAATFTPDVFCCCIPIVGITDLVTLLQNCPPYWADAAEQFRRRYGDVDTQEGRALLRSRSPLYKIDQIKKPMLIGHGANDVRCTLAQSDMIVAAMQAKGLPVTYVVFPDEGHGFVRPENNIAFNAILEAFLALHIGGRIEPVGGDFAGSSHEIRAGGQGLV